MGEGELENYQFKRGQNWSTENVKTLMQWVQISAIYLDVLVESTAYYRGVLRRHTILNLILSTVASTVSLSQFNIKESDMPELAIAMKVFFTVITLAVAFAAGFLKIYQIQEKLESSIRLQQNWTTFGTVITSEMQLPVDLRKDALFLIIKMKDTYTELFKSPLDVNQSVIRKVAERNGITKKLFTLSELFVRVIKTEASRMEMIDIPTQQQSKPFTEPLKQFFPFNFKPEPLRRHSISKRLTSFILDPTIIKSSTKNTHPDTDSRSEESDLESAISIEVPTKHIHDDPEYDGTLAAQKRLNIERE